MRTVNRRSGRGPRGHSLVEVLVAIVVMAAGLLPASQAVALAIRLGRKGEASARVALALMARSSLLHQVAAITVPRCAGLAAGSATGPALAEWWTSRDSAGLRLIRVHARATRAGWPVEDSLDVLVRCP